MAATPAASTTRFSPARVKLCISSIDKPNLQVEAQYNPKELQIDKQIPWQDHAARDKSDPNATGSDKQDDLEFNGAAKRSMSVELFFDCYEDPGKSVESKISILEELSSVQVPGSSKQNERRPHHCLVVWGAAEHAMKPFRCVIESLTTKYMMWDANGLPVRATCTVKLKEAVKMTGNQ